MRALITGVTGQDGSYLAEQLTGAGWEVWGMLRGHRHPKRQWLKELVPSIRLVEGDLLDQSSLQLALREARPEVVFNLAALTFVGMSWKQPALMTDVTGVGVLRLLEAIRHTDPRIRLVQASSSEMFGGVTADLMDEATPLRPRSPYGTAKCFAHQTVVNYRESYGMHACCAIMFNHESPRRGPEFVTRKITMAVAAISAGKERWLRLGRVDTARDWGWAPDYMRALPLMAQREEPRDYVLATGEAHTVAELCQRAFSRLGLDWTHYVVHDAELERPADVLCLRGYPLRAHSELGWMPKVYFGGVVDRMVDADAEALA